MSLIKQLWIGIIGMLALVLAATFFISSYSAKTYLTEQLQLKNIDNANALALSISQIPDLDPITLELLISAQFDSGHYEYILLHDTEKKPLVERRFDSQMQVSAPVWFIKLAAIDAPEGIAHVQHGWSPLGTLTLKSHSQFAYKSLWESSVSLLLWLVVIGLLCGLIGSFILKYISKPLDLAIHQAEAIGERRFITTSEPKTREFKRLVRAMNQLSNSVKQMLSDEAHQLDSLRREAQIDVATGLAKRAHFLNRMTAQLSVDNEQSQGVIAIARVMNLGQLNQRLGHQVTDTLLRVIANTFKDFTETLAQSHAARLNSSDFILSVATPMPLTTIGNKLSQSLNAALVTHGFDEVRLPISLCAFSAENTVSQLMHALDGGLAQAELKGSRGLVYLNQDAVCTTFVSLEDWRSAIEAALNANQLTLAQHPVLNKQGEMVHQEHYVRLLLDGHFRPAGYFVHWAARLDLIDEIDLAVVKQLIKQLSNDIHAAHDAAINISTASLCSAYFREKAVELLTANPVAAKRIWIEFPECAAIHHIDELRGFALRLRGCGCKVGLEHVGLEFTQIHLLQDLGLHYLKIDAALSKDIDQFPATQSFVQGLCTIAHSLGILMIAEGVTSDRELHALYKINVNGATGPLIRAE